MQFFPGEGSYAKWSGKPLRETNVGAILKLYLTSKKQFII